jgi:hypothetical protein
MSRPRRTDPSDAKITVYVPKTMHAELEAEAWEEGRDLSGYVRRLLTTRGKWARSVGEAGGYDVRGPANPPKVRPAKPEGIE